NAAKTASDELGFGSGSAPLISGHTRYHQELCDTAAGFKRSASALLFGSGYMANAGIIPALAPDGIIFSDSLNHASIIDGCRLSKATVVKYEHCNLSSLEALLKEYSGTALKLIITEGVFSMDGDIAPMPGIMRLAEEHGALVMLDEAHATGVIGDTGRGTLEYFRLGTGNIVQMGTLGKALGSYGAFCAADEDICSYLVNTARSFIFSTSLPPAACAAATAAIGVIDTEPARVKRLSDNAAKLRSAFKSLGYDVAGTGTPIIPLIIGDNHKAVQVAERLMEAGFYAPAIRPPTVPANQARIRFTVSAAHSDADIEALIDAVGKL
ncbi:MAG TPA: 8-amino-7-oxononanoate synthase, partial [Nitrospirota bacterium]